MNLEKIVDLLTQEMIAFNQLPGLLKFLFQLRCFFCLGGFLCGNREGQNRE